MFELLDVKWGDPTFGTESGTITWSSELGGDLDIASGFDLSDISGALRAAFDAWENVAAIDFQEVGTGGAVSVGTANLTPPVVGQAGPFPVSHTGIFTMTSADIEFSTNETWSPFGGVFDTVNFYAVAVHEIGHVIGLDHPQPPDSSQIMNSVISVGDLSTIDIAGAQYIYGTDGDDVVVEQPEQSGGDGRGDDGGGGGGGLGLLVAILGLFAAIFTGGAGAAVAMAAGKAISDGEDDENEAENQPSDDVLVPGAHDCGHGHHVYGDSAEYYIPVIDFTQQTNPCGCVGLCEHIIEQDEPAPELFI